MAVLAAAASFSVAARPSAEAAFNSLNAMAGRWEVFNHETGKLTMSCAAPYEYNIASDRRSFESISTRDGKIQRSRYFVLQVQQNRVLTFIEGEQRLTDKGDPVVWWAIFEGPNRFRWRRYDWPTESRTIVEWRRCS